MRPVETIDPGTTVVFETLDACGGTVESEDTRITNDAVGASDQADANPATGPVAIRGTEPGDTAVIDLDEIELPARGWACAFPGVGPLASRIDDYRTRFFAIDGDVGIRGNLRVPLRPMVGVVGLATDTDEIPTDFPGPHGGNLDNRFIRVGARVYLPVRQPGGMLALGDVHAAMGDGELTGSGLETSARVVVRVDLIKGVQADWPIVEDENAWYTHGAADDLSEAATIACDQAAMLLEREWGLASEDVPFFLTLAGDLGVCQACKPSPFPIVVRLGVLKTATAPHPFRLERT